MWMSSVALGDYILEAVHWKQLASLRYMNANQGG